MTSDFTADPAESLSANSLRVGSLRPHCSDVWAEMRAQLLRLPQAVASRPLTLEERPAPEPGPGEVRLTVSACGVCRTDLHIVEGELRASQYPIIPGHQIIGRVDRLGEGSARFAPGTRVGVAWLYASCRGCEFCGRGEENLCPEARFTGLDYDGGYADYVVVHQDFAYPIPEGFSDVEAAPLLCAGIVGYRSLRKVDLRPGESLGLVGFGASGHICLQVARHWGCPVYVMTRSEEHRRHARELGAAWAGGIEDSLQLQLDRIVLFAPAGGLVPSALEKLRLGGTLALNAAYMTPIPEMEYRLIYGERTIRSVANATRQDGEEFLKLAAQIPVQTDVRLYPLEVANEALLDLKESRINGAAVLEIGRA